MLIKNQLFFLFALNIFFCFVNLQPVRRRGITRNLGKAPYTSKNLGSQSEDENISSSQNNNEQATG